MTVFRNARSHGHMRWHLRSPFAYSADAHKPTGLSHERNRLKELLRHLYVISQQLRFKLVSLVLSGGHRKEHKRNIRSSDRYPTHTIRMNHKSCGRMAEVESPPT